VGLVPASAVAETSSFYIRLQGFDPEAQVLELAMQRAEAPTEAPPAPPPAAGTVAGRTVSDFLDVVASDAPTPGGGTSAAVAAAEGAALIAMVARLTVGKKDYEAVNHRMGEIVQQADAARTNFLALADRDAAAFDAVMAAFKLPKGNDKEKAARSAAIQRATEGAANAPLEVASRAADLLPLASEATETGNEQAASDGATAAQLLRAAVE